MNIKTMQHKRAFTLVEILTVIAIIGMLVGIVIGVAGYATRKMDRSKAIAGLEGIANGLEEYRVEFGDYPSNTYLGANCSTAVVYWLYEYPTNRGLHPFINSDLVNSNNLILDPWQRDYLYYHNPTPGSSGVYATNNNSHFGYDLWSTGPDASDPVDDINNWSGNL